MEWNAFIKQLHILNEKQHVINNGFYNIWLKSVLFTWRWWVAVGLIISPWVIWVLLRKKDSTDRLLYAGFFVIAISSFLDRIGLEIGLWDYPIHVVPIKPGLYAFDNCILPVVTMLCIQFFPNVSPYIKAVIYSAIGSFIFQPLNKWIGLYEAPHWKDYYSFPILICIYLAANYLASKNKFAKLK